MPHVALALGAAAVAALIVVIAIGIASARRPAPKQVRSPGVARAGGTAAPSRPDTAGLHLLDLD